MSPAVSGLLLVGLMALIGLGLSAFFTRRTIALLLAFWVSILVVSIIVKWIDPDASLYQALIGADESGMFLVYYGFILGLATRYLIVLIQLFTTGRSQASQS